MIKFKQFVTESQFQQEFIHTLPDALDIHMKHAAAGVPLPDRNDLYRIHPKGAIRFNKPDGGMVQFHAGDANGEHAYESHVNAADEPHREDGPSFISKNRLTYALHGNRVAEKYIFNINGEKAPMYSITHQDDNHPVYGKYHKTQEDVSKKSFDKHLAKHGFPPHED